MKKRVMGLVNCAMLLSHCAPAKAQQLEEFLPEINLPTAEKIGVTIPPKVLVRANRVIK